MRPLRWWFHRHQPALSGWLRDLDYFERCQCGAGRFNERGWVRIDPWPKAPLFTAENIERVNGGRRQQGGMR